MIDWPSVGTIGRRYGLPMFMTAVAACSVSRYAARTRLILRLMDRRPPGTRSCRCFRRSHQFTSLRRPLARLNWIVRECAGVIPRSRTGQRQFFFRTNQRLVSDIRRRTSCATAMRLVFSGDVARNASRLSFTPPSSAHWSPRGSADVTSFDGRTRPTSPISAPITAGRMTRASAFDAGIAPH